MPSSLVNQNLTVCRGVHNECLFERCCWMLDRVLNVLHACIMGYELWYTLLLLRHLLQPRDWICLFTNEECRFVIIKVKCENSWTCLLLNHFVEIKLIHIFLCLLHKYEITSRLPVGETLLSYPHLSTILSLSCCLSRHFLHFWISAQ